MIKTILRTLIGLGILAFGLLLIGSAIYGISNMEVYGRYVAAGLAALVIPILILKILIDAHDIGKDVLK